MENNQNLKRKIRKSKKKGSGLFNLIKTKKNTNAFKTLLDILQTNNTITMEQYNEVINLMPQ